MEEREQAPMEPKREATPEESAVPLSEEAPEKPMVSIKDILLRVERSYIDYSEAQKNVTKAVRESELAADRVYEDSVRQALEDFEGSLMRAARKRKATVEQAWDIYNKWH